MITSKLQYPKYINLLSDIFLRKGYQLYIVGGFVRDALMGRTNNDIDICSQAPPEEVISLLEDDNDFTIAQSNLPLGTILIKYKDEILEHTSFRRESYRRDGSHTPTRVSLNATIREDALRRDFTCNAIYYDIGKDDIIDFFDGIKDIQNKTLRTTREPIEVFEEDALRILRMVRISAETLLLPTEKTIKAANELSPSLFILSRERIVQELDKLLYADKRYITSSTANTSQGVKALFECGAANILFPGIKYEDSIFCVKANAIPVKIALFIRNCSNTNNSLNYICKKDSIKKDVTFLLEKESFKDSKAVELLSTNGYDKGFLLKEYLTILKTKNKYLTKYLKNMKQEDYIISMKTLAITGEEIKTLLGLDASPKIGEIKAFLLKQIISDPKKNNKDILSSIIKNIYKIEL